MPGARILDAPRYAWRGLSLDLARTFFTVAEIRRVIDLLALYKLNVLHLHLHLNDDQSWRLPMAQPSRMPESGAAGHSGEDLRALAAMAWTATSPSFLRLIHLGTRRRSCRLCPDLRTGRNDVDVELMPGRRRRARWLDPALPATFELIERASPPRSAFPGPYIHIGGDVHGMPHDLYAAYVTRMRHLVRSIGKRPLGWQESARAGLGPADIIQYWLAGIEPSGSLVTPGPGSSADLAMSRHDVQTAVAASAAVIMSPLAVTLTSLTPRRLPMPSRQPGRALWLRAYPPRTIAESFGWEPSEAAVRACRWGGRGRSGDLGRNHRRFDDLSFLLLPRLARVASQGVERPALV